jgi:hypothetical protein
MTRIVLVAAILIAGCGGSSGSNGNAGGGGSNAGGGGSNAGGGGGNAGGGGGSNAGGGGGSNAGGGGSSAGGGGGVSGSTDMASLGSGSFMCDTMSCGAGTECCIVGTTPTCASSCPDGGVTASCAKPSDCAAGAACCVSATSAAVVETIACAEYATCIPAASSSGIKTRACTQDSDCTTTGTAGGSNNTMYPTCCTNTATQQHVCLSTLAVGIIGKGAFTCP